MNRQHHKYTNFFKECPLCHKKYDIYWKIINHIRKSKDIEHRTYLKIKEIELLNIHKSCQKSQLHDALALKNNMFAGISYEKICLIITRYYDTAQIEFNRRVKISKTLSNVPKTSKHNENVSKAVKEAWKKGKFDTPETIAARKRGYANRVSLAGENNPMYGKPCPEGAGRGKGGVRKDIGHYVRSTWEANICRILILIKRDYEYEKSRFEVTIDNKKYTYSPDIFTPKSGVYYEIKGHARSSKCWKCDCVFCQKNKKIINYLRDKGTKIHIIGRKEYQKLKARFKCKLVNWEK